MSEMRSPNPEQLAALLDRALPPGTTFVPPRTKDPLVNTAIDVASLSVPSLSDEALNRIESRMLAAYAEQFPARNITRRVNGGSHIAENPPALRVLPRPAPVVLRWAAAAVFVLIFLAGSLTSASAGAIPGDWLYPVKRAAEQVELVAASGVERQVDVYLKHAQRRAEEALLLIAHAQPAEITLREAQQTLERAAQIAPELIESPLFVQRVSEITRIVESVQEVVPPVPPVVPSEAPGLLPPIQTSTASATASATSTESATPTSTPSPTSSGTTTPTAARTLSPTPSATATPRAHADTVPTATHYVAPTSPPAAPPADLPAAPTECPGNSCEARATHPPQGTPGGH